MASPQGQKPDKLGEILKQARIAKGYIRKYYAKRAKISLRYLVAIENEERKPSYDVLSRLVHGLGIWADSLYYPDDTDNAECNQQDLLIRAYDARERQAVLALITSLQEYDERQRANG